MCVILATNTALKKVIIDKIEIKLLKIILKGVNKILNSSYQILRIF